MKYETIIMEVQQDVAIIWLNRPEVRNAFNEVMIAEITHAVEYIHKLDGIRLIMLRGKGPGFCAGADLNWMRQVAGYDRHQNYEESLNLSRCFYTLYTSHIVTLAVVHGAAIGGANGLLSACDVAIATDDAVFSLSEVKIGIVPACISPYVLKRVGEYNARDLMLTGRRFDGLEAKALGLVNYAVAPEALDARVVAFIENIRSSGPQALRVCKDLLQNVSNHWTLREAFTKTASIIADIRVSDEGQEGMNAFLEKRKPHWVHE
jgi:methylglutaconyl-CoA hydratase